MTIREALRDAERRLEAAGVPTPRVDAELLLAQLIGTKRSGVYARLDEPVDGRWEQLLARREAREPLAYVLGEWGFRRLTLKVDPRVLVPRPETELVVERCLASIVGVSEPAVLDVGTGSGAIALAIADEHRGARVTGIDSSASALDLARDNARLAEARIELVEHDLSTGLPPGPWDLVVANPPYVPEAEIDRLEPEVRDWEPRDAILDRGQTEAVVLAARDVLRPGGTLVLETHWRGAGAVARAVAEAEYESPKVTKDLAGFERVVEARWMT
jgi:release factor glutamine methyltransferase